MPNKIKYLNTYMLMDYLTSFAINSKTDAEIEEIEEIVYNMEQSDEFKSLFFFSENEDIYLYQESDEQKVKDFISSKIDISEIILSNRIHNNIFDDYGNYLFDYGFIEFGKITIQEDDLYRILRDKYLADDKYIEILVNAGENFYIELDKIKLESLEYMVEIVVNEIKNDLKTFKF